MACGRYRLHQAISRELDPSGVTREEVRERGVSLGLGQAVAPGRELDDGDGVALDAVGRSGAELLDLIPEVVHARRRLDHVLDLQPEKLILPRLRPGGEELPHVLELPVPPADVVFLDAAVEELRPVLAYKKIQ